MDWAISHTYGENNASADYLANSGCREKKRMFTGWNSIPRSLKGIIRIDKEGLPNMQCKRIIDILIFNKIVGSFPNL